MSNAELQQLEKNIKHSQHTVELGAALERLSSNRDFRKVITEGYFKDEAIRLVHLLADGNMQSPESQKSIQNQMLSISGFHDYLNTLKVRADMARRSIAADEATRDEILAEAE